jgi:hypothetical protein
VEKLSSGWLRNPPRAVFDAHVACGTLVRCQRKKKYVENNRGIRTRSCEYRNDELASRETLEKGKYNFNNSKIKLLGLHNGIRCHCAIL